MTDGNAKSGAEVVAEPLKAMESRLTGRRTTDRLLTLSEGRYQSLIGAMAAIVWTTTPEGKQISEIPEWQEFTGQTREEAAGFGWADAIHPEDRQRTVALWRDAIDSGLTFALEHRLRRRDGVYRIMQVRAVPVRDEAGAIAEWVGMHQDITEQRNLETVLRQREWELSEAHRIARLGAWSWDATTDTVVWSDVVYEIFGRDKALSPPSFAELSSYHTVESWTRLREAVRRAVELGEYYELDLEVRSGAGEGKWIVARGEVEAFVDGKAVRLRGTIQDISERKARLFEAQAAEAAIRHSEERLRVAAESARFGMFDIDMVNGTGYWSRELRDLLGYPLDAPPPPLWSVPAFVHSEDAERLEKSLQLTIADGGGQLVDEHRIVRPDGTVRWVHLRGQVRCEGEGESRHPVRFSGTLFDITERKNSERALRKSEERFRKLFESDLLGIGTPHREGGFSEVNDEFLRIVGYTREDFEAGLVRWDWMTPAEYVERDREHIAEAMRRGSCTPYEKEYIRKDGSRVPILCGYASMETFPEHFIGFIQDLSKQKEVEAALRKSERMYRTVGEAIDYGVWACDADGGNTYTSDSFLRLVGMTFEESLGLGWVKALHPEDAARNLPRWERWSKTAEPWDAEHRFMGVDGKWHHTLARGAAVLDDNGQVTGWVGINLDIGRLKETEQALRESEQRFRVLAESLPSLIFVTEQGGACSYCNGRFLEYAGYKAEDISRIRWESFIHPEELPATIDAWRHCSQTSEPFLKEHRLLRHDGVYRWFLTRAMPVRDEQGKIARWFGSSTEVHEQKLAEQALRRSDKLAAMGRLAASVAHEINNPLASVTNALYLARIDESLSETTRGFLDLADQELTRVAQVATQTLRFYKQSTAPARVDVGQIVEQVVTVYAARLRGLSVEVTRDYGDDLMLYCFGDELRQVFANLIGNALDAMGNGGRLHVRVRRAGQRGLRVVVADTGSGIPAEMISQIFEPFVSTKADTGTGLGLWVSDGIVRKHGGKITVRSCSGEERHGTVFAVLLPVDGLKGGEAASS